MSPDLDLTYAGASRANDDLLITISDMRLGVDSLPGPEESWISFSHESAELWSDDDKAKFVKAYNRAVELFVRGGWFPLRRWLNELETRIESEE